MTRSQGRALGVIFAIVLIGVVLFMLIKGRSGSDDSVPHDLPTLADTTFTEDPTPLYTNADSKTSKKQIFFRQESGEKDWKWLGGDPAGLTLIQQIQHVPLPHEVIDAWEEQIRTLRPDTIEIASPDAKPFVFNWVTWGGRESDTFTVFSGKVTCMWKDPKTHKRITETRAIVFPPVLHEGLEYTLFQVLACTNAAGTITIPVTDTASENTQPVPAEFVGPELTSAIISEDLSAEPVRLLMPTPAQNRMSLDLSKTPALPSNLYVNTAFEPTRKAAGQYTDIGYARTDSSRNILRLSPSGSNSVQSNVLSRDGPHSPV